MSGQEAVRGQARRKPFGMPTSPAPVPQPEAPSAPRLFGPKTWLSLVITVGVLAAMVAWIDVDAVWTELRQCDMTLAALGMAAHYATYYVRGARWRRVLRHIHSDAGYGHFGLLVFFYNFVDNLVPAKLGDVYAAHLARINFGVERSTALGSIVFLRMIDAWIVLVLAGVGSTVVFADALPEGVVWALVLGGIIAAVATSILVVFAVADRLRLDRLPEGLQKRIASFRAGMWPRRREFGTIAALTVVIWALEALWILLLVAAFGIDLGPGELLFVTMIPLLASAFPLTPSGAGVVELSLYGCLRALDASAALAASITVLNRFIDYWLHILLGFVTWALRKRLGLRTWREVPLGPAEADGGSMPNVAS